MVTNIRSTTEDVSSAQFPKLVIQNNYGPRQSFIESAVKPHFQYAEFVAKVAYLEFYSGFNETVMFEQIKKNNAYTNRIHQ